MIACDRIGSGAAAAANPAKIAHAAFAVQKVAIPQRAEPLGILIHVGDRLRREFAAKDWHESAGVDAARTADEHHGLAVVHADRRSLNSARNSVAGLELRVALKLKNEPRVVIRLRCIDSVWLLARLIPELFEDLLAASPSEFMPPRQHVRRSYMTLAGIHAHLPLES